MVHSRLPLSRWTTKVLSVFPRILNTMVGWNTWIFASTGLETRWKMVWSASYVILTCHSYITVYIYPRYSHLKSLTSYFGLQVSRTLPHVYYSFLLRTSAIQSLTQTLLNVFACCCDSSNNNWISSAVKPSAQASNFRIFCRSLISCLWPSRVFIKLRIASISLLARSSDCLFKVFVCSVICFSHWPFKKSEDKLFANQNTNSPLFSVQSCQSFVVKPNF